MADYSTANQKELISALQSALLELDGVKVDNLIQQGLDIRNVHVDRQNHNAIHELVLNYVSLQATDKPDKRHMKFIDTLNVLVQNKLDINEGDNKNQTALHIAASSPGNKEILRVLLAHGARINQPDNGQQTALHKAVLHGTVEDVAILLERGADANFVDNVGQSPIHLAMKRRNNGEILSQLLKCGGKINLNNPEWNRQLKGATPLHTAARYGRIENAVSLLKLMAHPDITDAAGQTCLHVAAAHEISGKLCAQLVKFGAKVNLTDSICGETPLHKAVTAGIVENVEILLRGQADPNSKDHQGNTPLHKAAKNCNNFAIWQLLVKSGAHMDIYNINGQTPLTLARDSKNYSIMSLYWKDSSGNLEFV